MKYKKAQVGVVAFVFMLLFTIIIWFVWAGEWLATTGQNMIIQHNLTGLEAFIYANLNLWVWIGIILGTIGYFVFGAR